MIDFEQLEFRSIVSFISIISTSTERFRDFVIQQYESAGQNYSVTEGFLRDLGLINTQDNTISLSNELQQRVPNISEDDLKLIVIEGLIHAPEYRKKVADFLGNFTLDGDSYVYKPNISSRLKESGLRNFLIEIEIVRHISNGDYYSILEEHQEHFWAFLKPLVGGAEQFAKILEARDELGKAAEEEIYKYEVKRLQAFPDLVERIKIISKEDVGARYDILSFEEKLTNRNIVERFIEVKSVSSNDFKFYWTANEIRTAKILGNRYHLYLLPTKSNNTFDFSKLQIVQNPYISVFSGTEWNRKIELYSFSNNP